MSSARSILAALFMVLAIAPCASAGQGTATIDVTARVVAECHMTFTPLDFGSYDPLGANFQQHLDATATMVLTCTKGAGATVSFDGGRNGTPDTRMRTLAAAGQRVAYQLYRDSARAQIWGTGADAMQFAASAGVSSPTNVTVFGRIPAGQEAVAGVYTDLVTATVDF